MIAAIVRPLPTPAPSPEDNKIRTVWRAAESFLHLIDKQVKVKFIQNRHNCKLHTDEVSHPLSTRQKPFMSLTGIDHCLQLKGRNCAGINQLRFENEKIGKLCILVLPLQAEWDCTRLREERRCWERHSRQHCQDGQGLNAAWLDDIRNTSLHSRGFLPEMSVIFIDMLKNKWNFILLKGKILFTTSEK